MRTAIPMHASHAQACSYLDNVAARRADLHADCERAVQGLQPRSELCREDLPAAAAATLPRRHPGDAAMPVADSALAAGHLKTLRGLLNDA